VEKMGEVVARPEVLDSLAKIGEQSQLGESVLRVWGCILFNPCPVSQKEIEQNMGYSSGVVSINLRKLKMANMIKETTMGGEIRYFINTSLIDAFGEFSKRFFEDTIKPAVALLTENVDKIEDAKVKKTFHELINECKKLDLLVLIQARLIEYIHASTMNADMEDIEEAEMLYK
jgi:DNA-binding transcriptional regulator GbsR (MarR family)